MGRHTGTLVTVLTAEFGVCGDTHRHSGSRVRTRANIRVCARSSLRTSAGTHTRNVVFREFVEASGLYTGQLLTSMFEGHVDVYFDMPVKLSPTHLNILIRL